MAIAMLAGGFIEDFPETAREVVAVGEAAVEGDFGYRLFGLDEHFGRAVNSNMHKMIHRGGFHAFSECAHEVTPGEVRNPGQSIHVNMLMVVGFYMGDCIADTQQIQRFFVGFFRIAAREKDRQMHEQPGNGNFISGLAGIHLAT